MVLGILHSIETFKHDVTAWIQSWQRIHHHHPLRLGKSVVFTASCVLAYQSSYFRCCPPLLRKRGDIKSHLSICPSLCPSDRPSVCHKNFNKIEHWYFACMILVISSFKWRHAVTLTLTFDLFQGQSCCLAGTTILRICLLIRILEIYWDTLKEDNFSIRQYIPNEKILTN